ncbi:hypothetical protein ACIA48_15925 [Mycobacterium sp. NPDC051804]|uniref:hypothetical protein n=1 Tax=Mycobacterium sp. NPDC051804 TaxID=3364295 RepID=UPI00379BB452
MIRRLAVAMFSLGLVTGVAHNGLIPLADASPGAQNVTTESRAVRCMVSTPSVVCQRNSAEGFPDNPIVDGSRGNIVSVTTSGALKRGGGNIPGADENDPRLDLVLPYDQNLNFYGWTIAPTFDGTRFTNDSTGHGMFVSIGEVSAFETSASQTAMAACTPSVDPATSRRYLVFCNRLCLQYGPKCD